MLPCIIYINGPAQSGKTTLADALQRQALSASVVQLPFPLWEIADLVLRSTGQLKDVDEPLDFASQAVKAALIIPEGTHRWRDFLVEQANLLRKFFGPDVLSRICAETSHKLFIRGIDTIIYPNVRTTEDVAALIPLAPKREQVLIQLHRDGTTWENDNGYYLPALPGILTLSLPNNGTPAEMITMALNLLEEDPIA